MTPINKTSDSKSNEKGKKSAKSGHVDVQDGDMRSAILDVIQTDEDIMNVVIESVAMGRQHQTLGSSLRPWPCIMYVTIATSDQATNSANTRLCNAQARSDRGGCIRRGITAWPGDSGGR